MKPQGSFGTHPRPRRDLISEKSLPGVPGPSFHLFIPARAPCSLPCALSANLHPLELAVGAAWRVWHLRPNFKALAPSPDVRPLKDTDARGQLLQIHSATLSKEILVVVTASTNIRGELLQPQDRFRIQVGRLVTAVRSGLLQKFAQCTRRRSRLLTAPPGYQDLGHCRRPSPDSRLSRSQPAANGLSLQFAHFSHKSVKIGIRSLLLRQSH